MSFASANAIKHPVVEAIFIKNLGNYIQDYHSLSHDKE
jgi:hypothetical protein